MTILESRKALIEGKVTSLELINKTIANFEADNKTEFPLNAFLEIYKNATKMAEKADSEIAEAKSNGKIDELFAQKPLLGIPFAVKDNISVKGEHLTCSSKILAGYTAPYNATVITRLEEAGAIPVGRCNQDEFAMGSSTEYSAYGATRNPINREYVPGGSSGGSAAVVAAEQATFALGTETGGSVRLPASYCGVFGLKPTYGVLSRWGIVAFGSSLDQVGVFGKSPSDVALSLSLMAGEDFYDDTSVDVDYKDSLKTEALNGLKSFDDFKNLKIALPKQFVAEGGLDKDVQKVFENTKKWFESKGAKLDIVDLSILDTSIATYYVIALSEAASNLSRFDGIRYGNRQDPGEGYDELYIKTRSEGFGPEVKRRIIIGNYVLSEQFSGDCYKKAMTVRARMQSEIQKLYETYDIILSPVCPTPAFKIGQKVDDPMAMYLSDMFTIFVNLSRTCALSVPAGFTESNNDGAKLPIGMQFAGPMFSEPKLLRIAQAFYSENMENKE